MGHLSRDLAVSARECIHFSSHEALRQRGARQPLAPEIPSNLDHCCDRRGGLDPTVFLRVAAASAGIAGGFLAHYLEGKGWLANQARYKPQPGSGSCQTACQSGDDTCCSKEEGGLSTSAVQKKRFQGAGYLTEMWLVGRRLLLTFVIASFLGYLLGNLIPARWISILFGAGKGWSVPLGATLGLPFYLNISSSLPIARAFIAHGATPGAAMAFLLVGAGTSIGAVAGMLTIVRWRVAAVVTVTLWITAIIFGSAYNLLLAARMF